MPDNERPPFLADPTGREHALADNLYSLAIIVFALSVIALAAASLSPCGGEVR